MKTTYYLSIALLLLGTISNAQNLFTSGSTGADGPLSFTAPPIGRNSIQMAFNTDRQRCMVFGGWDGTTQFDDTWEFDGTRWDNVAPVFSPSARTVYVMTYDATRNNLLLYGGFDAQAAGPVAETWQFSDDRWTQITTSTSPGDAIFRSMAFDSSRNVAVMFGGAGASSKLSETWEFNGADWALTTTNGPAGRTESAMAFDANRNVTVLFGGNGESNMLNDVWEYNGIWSEQSLATAPSQRIRSSMTFDSNRNRMVLFGGFDGIMKNDTWEYTGSAWIKRTPANSPPARRDHALCYDPVQNRTILFGGTDLNQTFADTWEWDGTDWTQRTEFNREPVIDMSEKTDGVWNYTTVDIGTDVTLSFQRTTNTTPVVWLATGNVTIDGSIDISGENGADITTAATRAAGGPGGFDGGLGGLFFSQNQKSGEPGLGLGGGAAGINEGENGGDAGFGIAGTGPNAGAAYGNIFNAPIIGGSGGGGGAAVVTNSVSGGLGGGGGGALLIASSETIFLDGNINADGGLGQEKTNAGNGGDGSGGAVRLVADRLEGSGSISASDTGRIRLEGFVVAIDQVFTPVQSQAPPYEVDLAGQGVIRITQVDGAVVRATPLGDINNPDVIFTNTGPVTITLETSNLPLGTMINLRITSGSAVITTQSTAVTGTLANGNATATATVPAGSGTIQAFAEFTQ